MRHSVTLPILDPTGVFLTLAGEGYFVIHSLGGVLYDPFRGGGDDLLG